MLFNNINGKWFTCTINGSRQRHAILNYITLYTILFSVLGMFLPAQAMIYRPEKGAMWDPSVIWHDGKYYAFMMYNKEGREGLKAKHCLLASSTDGVHWKDEGIVNEERESARGCRFFKCFVARCGDKFIMDHGVARPDDWVLDLGRVCESARVRVNGRYAGTLWSIPFEMPVGEFLREGENELEVEVTNLSANRIADLDRRRVNWKKFYEINFVNIRYQKFDASRWPLMDSGLLGPVRLIPQGATKPGRQ